MRGFTRSLGVRCTHCHVGEEGKPLGSYDFVSDKNPNKDRAREMYRMLGDINAHLKKITAERRCRAVNMWCGTCHRGRPRPTTLGEEMSEARQEVRDRSGARPLSRASRPVRGRRNLRLSRTDSRGFRRGSRRGKRLRGSDRRPQAQRRGVSEVERCLGGPGGGIPLGGKERARGPLRTGRPSSSTPRTTARGRPCASSRRRKAP